MDGWHQHFWGSSWNCWRWHAFKGMLLHDPKHQGAAKSCCVSFCTHHWLAFLPIIGGSNVLLEFGAAQAVQKQQLSSSSQPTMINNFPIGIQRRLLHFIAPQSHTLRHQWSYFERTRTGENYSVHETFSVMLITCKTVPIKFLTTDNDKQLPNRYIQRRLLQFHCFHDSSITYIRALMILFWKNYEINWVQETFSVVLVRCMIVQVNPPLIQLAMINNSPIDIQRRLLHFIAYMTFQSHT